MAQAARVRPMATRTRARVLIIVVDSGEGAD
jgi:hypothetical protein